DTSLTHDNLLEHTLDLYAELLNLKHDIRLAELDYKATMSRDFPYIKLNAGYNYQHNIGGEGDEHFPEFWPDYNCLDEVKEHYQRGGLGDVKIKKFLNNVLQSELAPIRARRKELEQDISYVYDVLKKGSDEARAVAAQTLSEVKAAMKINYFDADVLAALTQEQNKKYGL
ncbi:MAG: hypothetical protein II205_05100, partial [Bacteroidales bacterium]|nr:hypothetical protein [Bacteroidales bacterium]